jgi:hypothetical protein
VKLVQSGSIGGVLKGYKYISSENASRFLAGSVRISAAHTFRMADGIDDGRIDSFELIGRIPLEGGDCVFTSETHPIIDDFFFEYRKGVRQPNKITMSGSEMRNIDNAMLFCLSLDNSAETRSEMLTKFKADACVEICDLDAFGEEVRDHSLLEGFDFSKGQVSYTDTDLGAGDAFGNINYFQKKSTFSWQCEYRFLWKGEITHDSVDIDLPSVTKLLSRVY